MDFKLFFVLLCVCSGLQAEESLASMMDDTVEIQPEDVASLEQQEQSMPPLLGHQEYQALGHSAMPYALPHAAGSEDLDLKKLWDMLTEGMSAPEKKAYAQEFLTIVQQHQERMVVRDATATKVLFAKLALVLAAVGVVVYIIYAVIAANQQETERARQRAKVDKIAAQVTVAQAAAAQATPAQTTAPLQADIDELKKQMAGVDAQIKAEVEKAKAEMRVEIERAKGSADDFARAMNKGVDDKVANVLRRFETNVASVDERFKQSSVATTQVKDQFLDYAKRMKGFLDNKFPVK